MRGLNKVQLIGNLGADPDIRYTQAGVTVANVRLATNFAFKDRTGEKQERTEWHRVVVFSKLGEIAAEYLKKGDPVYFEGRLQTRSWEKNAVTHYSTEIIATEMNLLGNRNGNRNGNGNANANTNQASQAATNSPGPGNDDLNDGNIPF